MADLNIMNKEIDIIVLLLDVGLLLENCAVFQSQVIDQMLVLRKNGYRISILSVVEDDAFFDEIIDSRLKEAGINFYRVPQRGFFLNLINMSLALRSVERLNNVKKAYIRGIWGYLLLRLSNPLKPLDYVYDVRGSLIDETDAVGGAKLKQMIYGWLEKQGIRTAKNVSAVSTALADRLIEHYKLDDVIVTPSCVDIENVHVPKEQIIAQRNDFGFLENEIVFVYAGGLSHYQQVPSMLKLWRRMLDIKYLRFLLLTNDDPHSKAEILGDLSDFNNRLIHVSLPRHEIPRSLATADVGFMLRDSRELNYVASPVKFAEYLSAGLLVVGSPNIGDTSDAIVNSNLGILLDPDDLIESESKLRELVLFGLGNKMMIVNRAQQYAFSNLSWQSQLINFEKLYSN